MNTNITTFEQFIAGIRARCCTKERAEVEFLRAQVRTLRGIIGNKRILLSDEQRRLLATTGMPLWGHPLAAPPAFLRTILD